MMPRCMHGTQSWLFGRESWEGVASHQSQCFPQSVLASDGGPPGQLCNVLHPPGAEKCRGSHSTHGDRQQVPYGPSSRDARDRHRRPCGARGRRSKGNAALQGTMHPAMLEMGSVWACSSGNIPLTSVGFGSGPGGLSRAGDLADIGCAWCGSRLTVPPAFSILFPSKFGALAPDVQHSYPWARAAPAVAATSQGAEKSPNWAQTSFQDQTGDTHDQKGLYPAQTFAGTSTATVPVAHPGPQH